MMHQTRYPLVIHNETYAVCQLANVPEALPVGTHALWSLTVQGDDYTLICEESLIPNEDVLHIQSGWRAIKIDAVLDFAYVGILADIATCLAKASISIYALSTYQTDVILVRGEQLDAAITALTDASYPITYHPFSEAS